MIEESSTERDARNRSVWPGATIAAVASLVVACVFLDVPSTGLDVPRFEDGDGLFHAFVIDSVISQGWYTSDPRLGAPFGSSLLDFPVFEAAHLVFLRILSLATRDPFAIETVFLIASFGLVAFVATFSFARFVRDRALASVAGFLFAILPYHFLRLHHLFLADYVAVALYGAIVVDVVSGTLTFFSDRRRTALTAFGLFVASGTGVYYAFFGCLLVAAAALRAWSRTRSVKPIVASMLTVAVLSVGIGVQAIPTLVHHQRIGENPSIAHRAPAESETYGLKPIELFLPTRHHRIPALDAIAADYEESTPLSNENTDASLGVLGSIGVFVALASFFSARARTNEFRRELGFLIVVALLYAAVGGGASIFAHLVVASIRSVNRISVFVAYFALLALAHVVSDSLRRIHGRRGRFATAIVVLLSSGLGIVDQVPTRAAMPRVERTSRSSDRSFVRALTSNVGPDASVLVLPYVRFPEGRRRDALDTYAPLRLAMASRTLRWSYGGMAGRTSDLFVRSLVRGTPEQLARQASRADFGAIVVMRRGFRDRGVAIVSELTAIAGAPIASDRDRIAFRLDPALGGGARDHIAFALHSGFHGWERFSDSGPGSWSSGDAALVLVHHGAEPEPVLFETTLGSPHARSVTFSYRGATVATFRLAPLERRRIAIPLDVPHGTSRLTITSDTPPAPPGNGDRRSLGFGIASTAIVPR